MVQSVFSPFGAGFPNPLFSLLPLLHLVAALSPPFFRSPPEPSIFFFLTNDERRIRHKVIIRNGQVQRRRPLARAARDVVVRAVAGTEPAAIIARFANWHAAQMCADAWFHFYSAKISL